MEAQPKTSGATPPHLSRGEVAPDPEAWSPGGASDANEPLAAETARRLGEADVEVLRPSELVEFSLAAGRLAAWADGLRRAAEARLVVLLQAR
ncbi:hypothetical protein [Sinomonas sp.]|uniref:hypothetical protein n=1 Tax=Sinomonas sp. TaxID=1914986 RepID=UPI002FE22A9A